MNDMSEMEFKEIMRDVSAFFGAPKDRQMEIMYDIFKAYPYNQMKRACRFLIEHHDNRYFPTPRDIHDALREVAEIQTPAPESMPQTPEEMESSRCEFCHNVGWWVEDRVQGEYKYSVAVYCSCARGQRLRQGHVAYQKRFHSGRADHDD